MRSVNIILPVILFVAVVSGCKKSAPYIDELAGNYKINGSISYDSTVKKNIVDSVVLISKINSTTLQFISGECDTVPRLTTIDLSYESEDDTMILFSNRGVGDHSPDNAVISFHNPPDGNFTYEAEQFCTPTFIYTDLRGAKVH